MSETPSSSDEYSTATSRAIQQIELRLVPLWSDDEKSSYFSDLKKHVKFSKSTVAISQHKIIKLIKEEATVVRVAVAQAIWGRNVISRQAWYPTFMATVNNAIDFAKYPQAAMLSLPTPVRSPRKRKATEPIQDQSSRYSTTKIGSTTEKETMNSPGGPAPHFERAKQDINALREEYAGKFQEAKMAYKEKLEKFKEFSKSEIAKVKTEQERKFDARREALISEIRAAEKIKYSAVLDKERAKIESLREVDRALCDEKQQELDELALIEATRCAELRRLTRAEHETLCELQTLAFNKLCEDKRIEYKRRCEERDLEHEQKTRSLVAELEAARDIIEKKQPENRQPDLKSNIHSCEIIRAKIERQKREYFEKNDRAFNLLRERLEREYQERWEKKERQMEYLVQIQEIAYKELCEKQQEKAETETDCTSPA